MSVRVAVVDDDALFASSLAVMLEDVARMVRTFGTLAEVRRSELAFDVFIVDVNLPDGNGMDLIRELEPQQAQAIVITADPQIDDAVTALRHGIVDFFVKPTELEQIRLAVLRASQDEKHRRQIRSSRPSPLGDDFVASLGLPDDANHLLSKLCESATPTLLTGETGTGKSMLARWIHEHSDRRDEPFVSLNCAALPASLVEFELFGAEKGAFTGAEATTPGLLETGDGGTVFLDELGEMPLPLQAKLLEVLDGRPIRRLGGRTLRHVDLRFIAATNVDARDASKIRPDLLYRLSVIPLELPPLRSRGSGFDILVDRVLHRLHATAELASGELERLRKHDWPGNARELRNVLERSVLLDDPRRLGPSRFMMQASHPPGPHPTPTMRSLEEVEREHVQRVVDGCDGNRSQAARVLGIAESTLRRKLR